MISVRQVSDLPPASFRFSVTQDTLAFGCNLPAVGRFRDFHPLEYAPAGRTKNFGRRTYRAAQKTTLYSSPQTKIREKRQID